jgi:hypothetical protein
MVVIATLSLPMSSRFPPGRRNRMCYRGREDPAPSMAIPRSLIARLASEHLGSAVSVEKRIARARPFLKAERLTTVRLK